MESSITAIAKTSNNNFLQSKLLMSLIGFTMGFLLIVIAIATDLFYHELDLTSTSVLNLYHQNVTHWIILTAPFFLSSFFYIASTIIAERERVIDQQLTEEKKQFDMLEKFISKLESGNFEAEVGDAFTDRKVATQLESFKKNLALQQKEESIRAWTNQGLASFSELLRTESEVDILTAEILRFLVKYTSANQGSVFLLDRTGESLDLKACYAYDRKKIQTKSIPVGEGLVGQCFLEKETIQLLDVPQNYISITSGLGLATPSCVIIVPLKNNDKVAGVIEVASFRRMEKHEIHFLEKSAEAFASVIHSVNVSSNVKQLLEQSQQQMEELRAQEEEMRQNMEELQAVQEQMARQLEETAKVQKLLEAREIVLGETTILSEADLHGTITFVNQKFLDVSRFRREELIGKGHNTVRHPDMPKELFQKMWSTIKAGKTFRGIVKNRTKDGGHYWVDATIVPIRENGKTVRYIGARYHITDESLAQKMYESQLKQITHASTLLALHDNYLP